jgi:hypothetical protein
MPPITTGTVCRSESSLAVSRCSNEVAIVRLFDHLVGTCEQLWWNFKAEPLRGPEIDDKVEDLQPLAKNRKLKQRPVPRVVTPAVSGFALAAFEGKP